MNSNIRFWITSALMVALLMGLASWGFSQWHLNRYTDLVANRLQLLNELRRGALQQYFSTAEAELQFWSSNADIVNLQRQLIALEALPEAALEDLRRLYVDENPHPGDALRALVDAGDGGAYSALHKRLHPRARLFVTERGYYDFFLISPGGEILYSVEKEADFGTNLVTGAWRDSGLADVFSRAMEADGKGGIIVSDMQAYGPSAGAPAIFLARGLRGLDGEVLGAIALQLPTDNILKIMNYTSGMGETGETYVVGPEGLMRSNSRFSEVSTVLQTSVDTAMVAAALAGEEGVRMASDYRGVEVLSAYAPLEIGAINWAVLAEIDEAEIVSMATQERPELAGVLSFFYGLSLWSLAYWRGRQLPADDALPSVALDATDFGDGAGING